MIVLNSGSIRKQLKVGGRSFWFPSGESFHEENQNVINFVNSHPELSFVEETEDHEEPIENTPLITEKEFKEVVVEEIKEEESEQQVLEISEEKDSKEKSFSSRKRKKKKSGK